MLLDLFHLSCALSGDVMMSCFAGDPFHSSSDFDLADDGGKDGVMYSLCLLFLRFWMWLQAELKIQTSHLNPYKVGFYIFIDARAFLKPPSGSGYLRFMV